MKVNVLGGSVVHIESLWTLTITPLVLSSSVDLILGSKNGFITILTPFISEYHLAVARLGLESTVL